MSLPAGVLYGEDNITVANEDSGYAVYGGYVNGSWPNMTATRARFASSAKIVGYSTRSDKFEADAEAGDFEPGTYSQTLAGNQEAAVAFCRQWNPAGKSTDRPVVYVMGSWAQELSDYLAAYGWDRSRYYLQSAHYDGLHLCGPASCGLLKVQADATQYATGRNDWNVWRGYVFGLSAPSGPVTGLLREGDTGAAVKALQGRLNAWEPVVKTYAPVKADGIFGGITLSAVRAFQVYAKLSVDGIVGPDTEAALSRAVPKLAPVPAGTFDHPVNLKVKSGHTNFIATWDAPAGVTKAEPVGYQVYVYKGTVADRTTLVKTYPRIVQPTARAVIAATEGSLDRHTTYTLHVVSGQGKQVRPWDYASIKFKTA